MSKHSQQHDLKPQSEPEPEVFEPGQRVPIWSRRDTIALCWIVAGALLLRLIYLWQYRACPTFEHPIMDPLYHVEWARAFARGESFMAGQPYFRAPLYPWILGLCYSVFGESFLIPRICQVVMGALSCGLIFLIGRRVFGRGTGVVAGCVAATYWLFLYFEGELLITPLIVFLDLLFIWLLLRADESRSIGRYLLCGLVLGLSAIARPNILLFGLLACVWVIVRNVESRDIASWRRAIVRSFLLGLACLLPILPITIRNYLAGDDLVLISSQGGVNFFIGNNAESDGTRAVVPGTRPDWWGGYHDAIALAEKGTGRELKPSEVSDYFFGKAFDFITTEPMSWLGLTLKKVRYFWNGTEIANNQPIRFFAERYGPIVKFLPIGFWMIAPLALLGLLLCLRHPLRLFPLWGFVVVYAATVILFFVCTRFRIPITGVLIILACYAGRWLVDAARSRQWIPLALGCAVTVSLGVWVYITPEKLLDPTFQGYNIIGDLKMRQGDVDGAIDDLRKGIELRPDYAALRRQMGHALIMQGRFDEAERELRFALALRGSHNEESWGQASFWLGYILATRNDLDAAIELFRQSISHDASYAEAHRWLGRTLFARGDFASARESLERAVKLNPELAEAHFDLGNFLVNMRRTEEGIEHLQTSLALHPENAQGWFYLANAYKGLNQLHNEVQALENALALTPPGTPMAEALSKRIEAIRSQL